LLCTRKFEFAFSCTLLLFLSLKRREEKTHLTFFTYLKRQKRIWETFHRRRFWKIGKLFIILHRKTQWNSPWREVYWLTSWLICIDFSRRTLIVIVHMLVNISSIRNILQRINNEIRCVCYSHFLSALLFLQCTSNFIAEQRERERARGWKIAIAEMCDKMRLMCNKYKVKLSLQNW